MLSNSTSSKLSIALLLCLFQFITHKTSSYRQHRRYLMRDRPKELADIVSEADFAKSQSYNLDKSRFAFVENTFKQALVVLQLHYDFLPWLWNLSGQKMLQYTGYGEEYEVGRNRFIVVLVINANYTA